MRCLSAIVLTAAALLSAAMPAFAHDARPGHTISNGERPRDIHVGDPLRRQLLNALRPAIEADYVNPHSSL